MFHVMSRLVEDLRIGLQEDLRQLQEQEEGDEAWGPGSDNAADIHGTPGESGAENENNIWDAFDSYIGDMVDDLMDKYDVDDEEALDFIFAVASDLTDSGMLLPIPDEDDPKEVAMWLGRAGTIGFERQVLDAALAASRDAE